METIVSPTRERKVIQADDELGPVICVAEFMRQPRTFLFAAKRHAARIHSPENPSFMRGSKTSKKLVLAWLDRNPTFRQRDVYPAKPKSGQ